MVYVRECCETYGEKQGTRRRRGWPQQVGLGSGRAGSGVGLCAWTPKLADHKAPLTSSFNRSQLLAGVANHGSKLGQSLLNRKISIVCMCCLFVYRSFLPWGKKKNIFRISHLGHCNKYLTRKRVSTEKVYTRYR